MLPQSVLDAVESGDPLPGTSGFAGELPDGRLARDVLGRELLYTDSGDWSHRPDDLDQPTPFPAGHVGTPDDHERVWRLPESTADGGLDALESALDTALDTALDDASAGGGDAAVAFSGGVDSALVADAVDAPLHVVGFPDSADVAAARESAGLLGRDVTVHELAIEDVEDAVPGVARAIGRTNAMDVSIALPLFFVAERADADRLLLGQGADELFGGYAKVETAESDPRTDADTVRGARDEVVGTLPAQLERDVRAVRATGTEPVTPLLHDAVVREALRLPDDLLVADGTRKRALRELAADRLPDPVAYREKKAVQYGSLVARELDRLARQAGFKRRMDDHVTRYVESVV
ncbi:asparagine synthase C-terminal domain-containing protein [Salarchaeum sp. JOR-1]|uniref:asparagine synthase C-terminal domain-containing protein n=1 Tax=Salarchaeum sp. JOR-1 TaxID=2599399 RepID=UPI001198C8DA|nr:asparagine synthetase B [Salarchaeum sp. JOR-1]QDX41248.1 asparagine synthetase B [Salarchaeum sp. JOR-1]